MAENINEWFTEFYRTTDNGAAREEYTSFFTPDARVAIGDNRATGTQEILTMRNGMWEKVASRKHTFNVFSNPTKPDEFLISGTVEYGLKSGASSSIDWIGKAIFATDGEKRAMRSYKVFLDTTSQR